MDVVDAGRELASVDLGDRRLSKRAVKLATTIQARPDVSFPELFNEAELEAHYRFTNNASVTLSKLLAPHVRRSWQQDAEAPYLLVVHDTTELSFPGESPREGLRFTGGRSYLNLHVSLLLGVGQAPVVLGLAGARPYLVEGEVWHEVVDGDELQALSCGSDRWRDAAKAVRGDAPVGRRLVHLMDREADDYPLWVSLLEQGDNFVIRSGQPQRRTAGGGEVRTHLQHTPSILGREVTLSRRSKNRPTKDQKRHPPRDFRFARLEVRTAPAEILRPHRCPTSLPDKLSLNIVEVIEVDPPEGEQPVTWRLVTTLPVSTGEEVERVVDFYRKRWIIEEFFKALKTGCALEERQAESRHALLNTLGLLAPVAVGLLQLRVLGRHEPDAPFTGPLTALELRVLGTTLGKSLPKRPTNQQVMLAVAKLGGHLKSNGDPGWMVLGRGYVKLRLLTEGWVAAMEHMGARKPYEDGGTLEM